MHISLCVSTSHLLHFFYFVRVNIPILTLLFPLDNTNIHCNTSFAIAQTYHSLAFVIFCAIQLLGIMRPRKIIIIFYLLSSLINGAFIHTCISLICICMFEMIIIMHSLSNTTKMHYIQRSVKIDQHILIDRD